MGTILSYYRSTQLNYISNQFRSTSLLLHLKSLTNEVYTDGASQLLEKIKQFRSDEGFGQSLQVDNLKSRPKDKVEIQVWLKTLKAHYRNICELYKHRVLNPATINDGKKYFAEFEKIYDEVTFYNFRRNLSFDDCALYFAYTLFQLIEKQEGNITESRVEILTDKVPVEIPMEGSSFELKENGGTLDCFNFIKHHALISE
jgi:hypothetical protein